MFYGKQVILERSAFPALPKLNISSRSESLLTRSVRCKVVSGNSLNTLTFLVLVLVSFSPLCRPSLLLSCVVRGWQ